MHVIDTSKHLKKHYFALERMSWLYSLLYSCSVMSDFLWPHGLQHARLPCPSLSPGVCTNSCPLSQWCHPTISSSVIPSPPTFNLSQHQGLFKWVHFVSGGQSIGVPASASVLPMNIQDWFSLGWTGWISLQSMWLSSVFSNTIVQKHQFFGAQLSLWSNSHNPSMHGPWCLSPQALIR